MHFFLSPHANNLPWIQFTEAVFESVVILDVFVTVFEFIKSCFKHFNGTFWRYNFITFSCTSRGKSQAHNKINCSHPCKKMHSCFIAFSCLFSLFFFKWCKIMRFLTRKEKIWYQAWKSLQVWKGLNRKYLIFGTLITCCLSNRFHLPAWENFN